MEGEADGKELNEGCSTTENHNFITVTMETTEQSELVMNCEVEVTAADEQEKDFNAADEHVCLETDSSGEKGIHGTSLTDLPDAVETNKLDCLEDPVCSEIPGPDQKEDLTFETGHEELNRNESITSSVSDTSADSVYENEAHRKRQETPEQDPELESEQCPEPKQDPELELELYPEPAQDPELDLDQFPEPAQDPELDLDQYPEPEQDPELDLEQYPKPEQDPELDLDQYPKPEQDPELDLDQYPEPKHDPERELERHPEPAQNVGLESEQYPKPEQDLELELEHYPEPEQDPELQLEQYPEPAQYPIPEHYHESEQYTDPEQYPDPEPEQYPELQLYPEPEATDNELNPEDDSYKNLAIHSGEDAQVPEIPFEPPTTEESILEQCIREEAMSDISSEPCHDLDPDEIEECLRVEIAAASSDSETDEKWRTIFSSSINKEDDDSYLDSLQLSAQELFVQKVEVMDFEDEENHCKEVQFEAPQVEEVLEQPDDGLSFSAPPQEVKYIPLSLQGLSKISEDESENANHNDTTHQQLTKHTYADPSKKLPKDFCVIQETKSENVSTEHVDFQLARKQWREMEEQTKNKIILPTAKKPILHGSHSFMYTPVRNIERTNKRAHDLESLNLVGDYPHTQFSPCSEDSGLDDSSYRSPCDDPETPVEREIRISMEREENFKRERGFSRMGKSTDCAPSRSIPRSISTPLTPSFIITSSPTKEPLKNELSANNVIILDPCIDLTSRPRHGQENVASRAGAWRSEDNSSNLIILETSNLIIRSASEFSLNKAGEQSQEKMFLNNPFFKLRSRSTISLVDEEIKMVKQREEELRKERANLYGKDSFNAERMLANHMDTLAFDNSVDMPVKCKSSPSSPMKTAYRMDRSTLSCDHRFPDAYTGGRRKSAMALRWEAGEFTKTD